MCKDSDFNDWKVSLIPDLYDEYVKELALGVHLHPFNAIQHMILRIKILTLFIIKTKTRKDHTEKNKYE